MKEKHTFTVVLLMQASPKWLSLSRENRAEFTANEIKPIFDKLAQTVHVRLFDSEYFNAQYSDFMLIETDNLEHYQELIERLRDTKIYAEPYFEIKEIIVGQENRFADFDTQFKMEKS
ncbi:hypothetical protein LAG90_03235 [Marinilongibacter aquaticus]|uniref:darcynin family protein n=1 Tax=Marinilongibacter aquaticus TaxID=2975157 RepID=UPI0021BDD2F2|nr:darcynin family protein [Marinilongibacter aquaticus]UBM59662.1 hypothetical protein LAG90_03235 [Marinilongibacter aquaticus]